MSTITNYNSVRRQRVLFIPYGEVLSALLPLIGQSTIDFMQACGLPPTAQVVTVFLEGPRDCFGFMVEDESFDICNPGIRAPEMEITWERVTLDVKPPVLPDDPAQAKLSLGQ